MEKLLAQLRRIVPTSLADAVRPAYHYTLAVLGAVIYRFPGRQLTVIGVTGTDGKSTTCHLVAEVLRAGGHTVGMTTTTAYQIGDTRWENTTKMTSLGRFGLQRLLRRMVDEGCNHAVVEVSSQALIWWRVWGVPFQTAVFTNLSREHLDNHKTMEGYRNAKGKLFAGLAGGHVPGGKTVSVVNGDDAETAYFLQFLADAKYVFGTSAAAAEIQPLAHTVLADDIKLTLTGGSCTVHADETKPFVMDINLPGRFNISNALAAAAVGLAHGLKPAQVVAGIAAVTEMPGRMERVEAGQPFNVVIDFAVSPQAFESVLGALREQTSGKLITVFGSAGERDQGKRPLIGAIASRLSDVVIITEDDPASEDPADIAKQIAEGIDGEAPDAAKYHVILNRREAIAEAVSLAEPGDTVALLGKGHEKVMSYATGKQPWNERAVAAEAIAQSATDPGTPN